MTKADLVEQVAEAIGPGITKKDCSLVVDGFLNAVKLALANGDNVCLEFEAAQQSDRTLMASMINAKTCDEAEAAAYAAAGATGKNRTALLLLGLLGAGAIAIGIAQATDNNNQPDVVTQ